MFSHAITLEILNQWKNANETDDFTVTIATESLPGAAAARNKGLHYVDSNLLAFFDSDDTMRPTAIADYVEAFTKNPKGSRHSRFYGIVDTNTRVPRILIQAI